MQSVLKSKTDQISLCNKRLKHSTFLLKFTIKQKHIKHIRFKCKKYLPILARTSPFKSGGYKEMSSIFADQSRPRNTSPNAVRGGSCGVSANEYSRGHGAQINFGDLGTSIFNLYALDIQSRRPFNENFRGLF